MQGFLKLLTVNNGNLQIDGNDLSCTFTYRSQCFHYFDCSRCSTTMIPYMSKVGRLVSRPWMHTPTPFPVGAQGFQVAFPDTRGTATLHNITISFWLDVAWRMRGKKRSWLVGKKKCILSF
jgi:hypothetical protein